MATSSQQKQGEEEASSSTPSEPPLWQFVTKIKKMGAGGTWEFKCNICNEPKKGSYSRVRAHLLGIKGAGVSTCKKATMVEKTKMKKLEDDYEEKKEELKAKEVGLPCEGDGGLKKRKAVSNPIERAFGVEVRDQLDQEIARMFYTGGLPFNLARNPHYHRAFQFAANHKIDGYVPPNYNKLRTTLLQKEKENVHKKLEPIRRSWKEKGVSIVTDGWSDPNRTPLINFMAASGNGPMFIKSVNCSGEYKDKFFIAKLMKEVINEVGHENVVQVITDNASVCKAAGELIMSEFHDIYWTPCVVHTLNLALKNICEAKNVETNQRTYDECHWITEVHNDAITIKNFIMNHGMRLSIFSNFTPLKLLSVANTRFASIIVMLKRLKLIKRPLQSMVISDEWASYKEDDTVKADYVKERILEDAWWDKVSYILRFSGPIYDMLRACDTDKPCLHLVYEMWDTMIEKVRAEIFKHERRPLTARSSFYDVVKNVLMARWGKNNTPLHCLAHSLNPRYYTDAWLSIDPARVAPHMDGEVSLERQKCFKRLFPNEDEHKRVLAEYALFSMKGGHFEDLTCISLMDTMEPRSWWANFGAQTPLLQTLAFKLLSQPTSSSCAERNWSTYAFIHSLRRNKLTTSRAQDLVFVHNNLRLLSRATNDDDVKMWDIGGDAHDSLQDVGYLEFADLSLDEPELENIMIDTI
ncbi:hypothetical protein SSX86_033058 [Deinandra increscens subsp. villosa]|uniref:BED-type domain-containing protein n=2 Tax=Deinandra increscens subsp. villosa TaxID=3103831 RepID=A0AAP0C2U6_9ASTR